MTPADKELALLIQRALKAATPTLGDIAKRLGVSYDAVRSWSIARSSPQPESVAALASLLDEQADVLRGIAADLRTRE
jgi:transcriptional regulator with XRE-family HTH domain